MSFSVSVLRNDERAIYKLRDLYRAYGYLPYKVNKFEEYDLYADHKNFLISDKVLTFTDVNGKLMALKPDVTLSIVKNVSSETSAVNKFYYNETVYRTTAESGGFKEIMQTGLECIGRVTPYEECEVIMLAARSLADISDEYIMDLSHMGFLDGLFEDAEIGEADRRALLGLLESKNTAGIRRYCERERLGTVLSYKLCLMSDSYLPLAQALSVIRPLVSGEKMQEAYRELAMIAEAMTLYGVGEHLYLDLSMMNDQNYYDGVVFKGFIRNVAAGVLSGGRYDKLMTKFGKRVGAIGFAVYLDRLERLGLADKKYDVDILLLYDESSDRASLIRAVDDLTRSGKSVFASQKNEENLRFAEIWKLEDGEVTCIETNG